MKLRTFILFVSFLIAMVISIITLVGFYVGFEKISGHLTEQASLEVADEAFVCALNVMQQGGDRVQIRKDCAASEGPRAVSRHYVLEVHYTGPRDGPKGPLESAKLDLRLQQAVRTGELASWTEGVLLRMVYPVRAEGKCLRCHTAATPNQVLGLVEVKHDMTAERATSRTFTWFLLLLISPVPILCALMGWLFLERRLRRSLEAMQQSVAALENNARDADVRRVKLDLGFPEFNALYENLVAKLNSATTGLRQESRERLVLFEIVQGASVTANLGELLQLIYGSLKQVLYAENCFVALYDPNSATFSFPFFADLFDAPPGPQKLEKSCTALVFRTGRPMLILQEDFDRLVEQGEVELIGTPSPAWMGVPLRTPEATIGVLVVQHYEDAHVYTLRDLELLDTVGVQIAAAIQRKRDEDALRESEQRFRGAFESAAIGVALVGPDGRWLSVNRALTEITGYSGPELLATTFQAITHPDDLHASLDHLRRMREGAIHTFQLEKRYIHKRGHTVWLSLNVSAVRDSQGKVLYFVSQFLDISERKEAEEKIRRLNRVYAVLSEVNQLIVRVRNVDELFQEACRIAVEHGWFRLVWVGRVEKASRRVRPVAQGGFDDGYLQGIEVSTDDVSEGRGPTGTAVRENRHVVCNNIEQTPSMTPWREAALRRGYRSSAAFPLRVSSQVVGVINFYAAQLDFFDSDEIHLLEELAANISVALESVEQEKLRVQAEAALRESEARYRELFENATYGIFRATPEGKLLDVNPALVRMLGYSSKEELLAVDLTNGIYRNPADRAALLDEVRKKGRTQGCEVEWKRKDGRAITVLLSGRLLQGETGEPVMFEDFVEDVTERRTLEQQFRQAQKMEAVGRLAGGVAHDFNNLLGVIIGYGELIEEQLGPDDPGRKKIQEVLKAGRRAVSLTRQLLAFSRQQVLQPQVLNLNAVIQEAQKMLGRLIGEDVEVVTFLDPALGQVKADPGQIEQVLLNLVLNARDAMPQGGKLTIKTANAVLDDSYVWQHPAAKPGPYAMLEITDTGVGMDKEIQSHIFEPFFTTKERGKGTGLGLATVYGIVKQSSGFIWVYSEPGQGTTFRTYLPRVDEAVEDVKRVRVPQPALRGTETLLLVEDEASLRLMTREMLAAWGYSVLDSGDPSEAIAIAQRHKGPIHLLITDVVMPGMSGPALAEQLTALRPELKVLFTSGYTDDAIVRHGVLQRGIAFLQKPYAREALSKKVREVLDAASA